MASHNEVWVKSFFNLLEKLKLTTHKLGKLKPAMFLLKYKLGPLGRTKRKPRTTSRDMYGSSIFSDSDSFFLEDSPAKKKIRKRIAESLCRGCGNKPNECRCKRKGE